MRYLGLAILGAAFVALLILGSGGEVGGFDGDRIGQLAYLSALLILVTSGVWYRFRDRMGESLRSLLVWLIIFLVAVAAYAYREQAGEVRATVTATLWPGTAAVGRDDEVAIARRADGAFAILAEVNGRIEERFTFDTGASSVVLTNRTAAALGIKPSESDFTMKVSTANGTALAAPIRIDSITIGPITERGVDAMVSRPGALTENLLGQSFLDRLSSYEVRGDRLILRGR